jgi:hypothetical protein
MIYNLSGRLTGRRSGDRLSDAEDESFGDRDNTSISEQNNDSDEDEESIDDNAETTGDSDSVKGNDDIEDSDESDHDNDSECKKLQMQDGPMDVDGRSCDGVTSGLLSAYVASSPELHELGVALWERSERGSHPLLAAAHTDALAAVLRTMTGPAAAGLARRLLRSRATALADQLTSGSGEVCTKSRQFAC